MANFRMHVQVAAAGSASLAVAAANVHIVDWLHVPWLIAIGTVGGLLPDIDSDNTKQVKWLFILLAIGSSLVLLTNGNIVTDIKSISSLDASFCEMPSIEFMQFLNTLDNQCFHYSSFIIASINFVMVRYLFLHIFKLLTVHRGVFHSILAILFFSLLITVVSYHLIKVNALSAWLNGCFLGMGILIHLLLDELYSVDLANTRIKRSFGTALKLFNYNGKLASFAMLLATLACFALKPPVLPLLEILKY